MRFLLIAVILSTGCKPKPEAPTAEKPEPERLNPVKQTLTPPPVLPEPPSAPERIKREILVGGCNESCNTASDALQGFLDAVLNRKGLDAVRPFVNTAALIHNGKRHGDTWAQMFLDRKLGERREDIDKWLNGWLGWSDRIVDPADRTKPSAGVTVVTENQRLYVVKYRHPDIEQAGDGRTTGPIWKIVLNRRGLEWLVMEIDETPADTIIR